MAETTKVLLVKVQSDIKHLQKGLKQAQANVKKSSDGIKRLGSTVKKVFGAAIILKFFKDSVAAANKQEEAINKLNQALINTGATGVEGLSKKLQQAAADIQKITTVGDEASLEVMQLGLSMGVATDKVEEATKQAIGLSKAYQVDLKSAIKMVALAHKGDYNMLQRYIPQLKLTKDATEKNKIAMKALADGFKIAKAETETFGGKLKQLGNTFGDFKEAVGAGITQSKGMVSALDSLKKLFESEALREGIKQIVSGLAELLAIVIKIVGIIPSLIGGFASLAKTKKKLIEQSLTLEQRYQVLRNRAVELRKSLQGKELIEFRRRFKYLSDDSLTLEERTEHLIKLMRDFKGSIPTKLLDTWREKQKKAKEEIEDTNKALKKQAEMLEMPKIQWGKVSDQLKITTISLDYLEKNLDNTNKAVKYSVRDITTFKEAWIDAAGKMQLVEAMTNAISDVLGKLGININGVVGDITNIGKGLLNAFSGDIFSQITGIAQAIGGVVSAIGKLFKGDGIGKAIKRQNAWMNLTKETQEAMKKLAKEVGDTHKATSIMLDDIIKKSDITIHNFDKWTGRVREIISDFIRGKLVGEEFAKEFGEAFSALADEAQRLGTEGSKAMLDIFADLKGRGLKVAEVQDFINKHLSKGVDFYKKLKESQGEFSDISISTYDKILALQKKVSENKALLDSFKNFSGAFIELSKVQKLSDEEFKQFSTGAAEAFDKLKDKGFTATEAMGQMKDTLRRLAFLQNEFGYSTDEATQKLLDMAKQEGLLDGIKDPISDVVDILGDMRDMFAKAFGFGKDMITQVGTAFKNAGSAAAHFGKLAGGAMGGLGGGKFNVPLPAGDIDFDTAQSGLHKILKRNTLILGHKEERVDIDKPGKMGQAGSVVNLGPIYLTVTHQGGEMNIKKFEKDLQKLNTKMREKLGSAGLPNG